MAKQLNVNLAFTADTGKAKQQIQELQSLLSQIAHTTATSSSSNKTVADLKQASEAAKELQFHLNNAFNTTTGKFDLSLLDRSLQSSKSSIASLSTSLLNAGSTGQQAFLKLAQSISLADQPMLRISNRMREFGTVMKNTIKWQLSSSMIHGFMGALQSAYGYAQDLNRSLNDIRIVTGASVDEMARFAEQANKSAKALSTTTTDYTKASLIYYQQGLNAEEVQKRTDVTIKMANVAGTSAQTVSDQMTAVWNNFYDGTKSLEYYADVMTALGAKTASSVDEISGGLEKFAAIGDTIGLSYEYAAAALATITSNTRQSEEVVGTALKTIFARIQGLNLGETLDDGTTLNKYSQALEKVGISIFDQQGELKNMDNILDEMAAKWENLSKAQQTALAQTVAGTRQYTQLVALMDNWNKNDADSMKANLATAYGAEGSLQAQADIYAESWEAAEKRVRASAEGIFQSLLDDKFFIKLNNGFANVLTGIDAFIDGLGGVKPLITGIASIFLTNFAHKIPQALEDVRYNLQLLSPNGMQNAYNKIQTEMQKATTKAFDEGQIKEDSAMGYAIKQANELTVARNKLALVSDKMSDSERQMANAQLSIIQATQDEVIALKQKNEELQKSIDLQLTSMSKGHSGYFNAGDAGEKIGTNVGKTLDGNSLGLDSSIDFGAIGSNFATNLQDKIIPALRECQQAGEDFSTATVKAFDITEAGGEDFKNALQKINDKLKETKANGNSFEPLQQDLLKFINILPSGIKNIDGIKQAIRGIRGAKDIDELTNAFHSLETNLKNSGLKAEQVQSILKQFNGGNIDILYRNVEQLTQGMVSAEQKGKVLQNLLNNFQPTHIVRTSEALGSLGGMLGNVVTIGRSISSIFSALSNPDLSGWEKFATVLTGVSMIIPSVTSMLRGLSTIQAFANTQVQNSIMYLTAEQAARMTGMSVTQASIAIQKAKAAAAIQEAAAEKGTITVSQLLNLARTKEITATQAATIARKLKAGATLEEAMAEAGLTVVKGGAIGAAIAHTSALVAETLAAMGLNVALAPLIAVLLLFVAAVGSVLLVGAGLVATFNAIKAASPEGQLKALQEAANQSAEAFKNAKSAYDDLMSDSDSYHSKQDALDELTKGTEEWNQALLEANSQVVDLINKYPELAQYMSTENGHMTISDEGWDALISAQSAQVRSTGLQTTRLRAETAQFEGKMKSDELYSDLTGPSLLPGLKMAAVATTGTPYSIPTKLIAGIADAIDTSNKNNFNEFARLAATNGLYANDENKDKLKDLYKEVYGVEMLDSFYAKLENSAQSFYDLGISLKSAQGQLDAYTQSLVNNAMEISGTANSENAKALSNAVSDIDMNEMIRQVKRETTKNQAKEQYAKLMGYGYKDGKFYSSTNPAEMTKDNVLKVDMKDVYTALAENQAMNELASSMSKLDILLTDLNDQAEKTDTVEDDDQFDQLSRILTGDITDLRQSDIDAVLAAGGIEEYLKNWGIEAQDYNINTDAITQSINSALEVERNAIDSNIMSQEKFDNLTSDLTAGEANNFNQALTDLGDKYGEEFAQAFGELTGSMKESLDEGIQDDFIIGLSKIQDLTDAEAIDAFCDSMLELEDITEEDIAAIEEFREEAKNVALAVKDIDLDKVAEEFDALKSVIEKSKDGDREYTKEEKEALDAMNFDTSKFIETLDGFVYVGEAAELQAQASQHMLNTVQQAKENYLRASMAAQIAAQKAEEAANDQVSTAESSMTAVEQVKNIFASWGEALSNVWQNIVMRFQQVLESVAQVFIDIYNTIVDFINSIGEAISSAIEFIANAIIDAMNAIIEVLNELKLTDMDKIDRVDVEVGPRLKRNEDIQAEAAQAAAEEAEHDYQVIAQTAAFDANGIEELNTMVADGLIPLEAYNNALDSILDKEIDAEGLDADVVEKQAEAYEDLVEAQTEAGESAEELDRMGKRIAVSNARVQKGIDNLAEGWEEWSKALKTGNKLSEEYQTAIAGIEDVTSDMLGIDLSNLSEGFAESAYEAGIFERIMQGDMTALDDLRLMAANDIIVKAELDYSGVTGGKDAIDAMIQQLVNNPPVIGASLDSTEFGQSLLQMLSDTDMTVAQMQALFDALGYEPVIDYIEIPAESASQSQMAQAVAVFDPLTGTWKEGTVESGSALAEGTMIRVPVINGSKTKYTGSGASSGYTPPKTSNNGGGGGGSDTPKYAEKKNDSDKERYHTLQNQLEDLRAEYDLISDAKDRAFGTDKLKNLDDEINKTQELIDKQEEYIKAIETDLPVDKAIMDAYYSDLIGGRIQYDEKGNISNYDEIQDAMYAKYNQMADLYTEDSEEWEVFEKKYEQLEEYIEQYEETYDLLRDEEAEYQELLNQRMDLELEKIQYAIELKLNVAEDSLALLDYQMSRIEDDAFKAAEAIGLFAEKAELLYDQMTADREGLNDILGQQLSSAEIKMFYEGDMSVLEGKTFTDAQVEAIKEYRDNLIELSEEFDEIRENIEEQVMEVFDAWNEKLETGIESLEHYGSVLESYKNIIDIVGEDGLGISNEFIKNLNEAQIGNAIDKVNATRDAYEAMMQAQQEAEEALEDAKARGDEASIKMWTENLAELTDEANSAQEEFLSAWEDALDMIAEQFEMTVERIIDSFNESIYALGGLEGLSEEFARQQETADIIMDDYQKIYELSKLSRDVQKTLDDTKIISGKQKLKKLMSEINDLQAEGVEMSQYDLEYLQAEYELRLAEIELEEARNAKDTVRLSKDNEGNWSYVYTQNSDAVDEAQQKYEDALYSMQDISSNYIDEMSEKLIETSEEMADALAALRIEDFASIDDYYAEVERIQKQYQDEMALQEAELQKAVANNKILYDEDMKNYEIATGGKYRLAQDFATAFKDTLLGNLMDSESNTVNYTDLISEATTALTSSLLQAAETYYINLENAMNAADTTTEDFATDTAENIDKIVEASKTGAEAVDQMAKEMTEAFGAIADSVSSWQETYGMAMQEIVNSNMDVIESFNKMLETLSLGDKKITVSYDIIENQDTPAEAFDTGGYTGEWGRGGRIAVVHQKELILNEDDTSNFLSAIELTRMMLETIDLNARQASLGLGGLIASTIKEDNTQMLEQQVHITAEFPGITDRYEVENALTNLVNRAAQYANRK